MDYRYLIYGIFLYMFGQFFAWLQSYGPLIFPKLKDNTWILYVTAPVVTFFYLYATRYTVQSFNGIMWPSRIISFSVGVILFTVLTNIFMKEGLNAKMIVSLSLCVLVLLIQIFWKTE